MISEDSKREKLDSIVELRDSLDKFRDMWLISKPTTEDAISMSMIALACELHPDHHGATMCLATALAHAIKKAMAQLAIVSTSKEN